MFLQYVYDCFKCATKLVVLSSERVTAAFAGTEDLHHWCIGNCHSSKKSTCERPGGAGCGVT